MNKVTYTDNEVTYDLSVFVERQKNHWSLCKC